MDYDVLRKAFKEKGYVLIKQLLSEAEAQFYIEKLENLSQIKRNEAAAAGAKGNLGQRGLTTSWSTTDGVTKTSDFWPIIFNERLLTVVRELLGQDIRFLQHTDLHVGFSAISWHRDNVSRTFGVGPDWDETKDPYALVRVGIYLQTFQESQFKLGFISGSHIPVNKPSLSRRFNELKLNWLGVLSYVFTNIQRWVSNAEWIATEPGDCIIFDPRTTHSGSYIKGPKYSIFVAYGRENIHFYHHQNYYRHVRPELHYQDPAPELVKQLKVANLYPEERPVFDKIDGAWVPPATLQNLIAKKAK